MNITSIWNSVYPVLVAILFFELIIVIHEWGHFTAARLMKIKVNEFSVGMGPKLLQHKGKKTTYTLRLILFGGYCSMEGEDKESDDENAFVNKKVWQRIYVVIAGALMNLVLGLVIVLVLVCSQNLVGTTEVAKFDDNAVSQSYGPGLGVRIIGEITADKIKVLQDADWVLRDEMAKNGYEKNLAQFFCVLPCVKTVGVMGDHRTYDHLVAIRAVTTDDFMTADWAKIPYDILAKVSNRITNEVEHINRVVYDITSKPPGTVEWE